jgi:hypothetical protein
MKKMILLVIPFLFACASDPNKAEKLKTEVENPENIANGRVMGTNSKDELITQKKVKLSDYVTGLEKQVYELEDGIYGSEEYGSKGQWGVLEECLTKANSVEMGGEGTYVKMPEKARLTTREDSFQKFGYDEKKNLVAVSTDFLKDRIRRFENYKETYQQRKDWYSEQIKICDANLNSKAAKAKMALDLKQYPKIVNTEVDMDNYICNYVHQGAKLRDLIKKAQANNWIPQEEQDPEFYVNGNAAADGTNENRTNVLRLGAWSLSFDNSVKYRDVDNASMSPKLAAWMHEESDLVPGAAKCLKKGSRVWNNGK